MEGEQVGTRLNVFEYGGKSQPVSFVETNKVTDGVAVDVYEFDGDVSKDLGILRIDPGLTTPLQRVLKGTRTIEGHVSGKGKLVIIKPDDTQKEYSVSDDSTTPFLVSVSIGDRMQWQAETESPLVAYEICFPPYEDGRFENL